MTLEALKAYIKETDLIQYPDESRMHLSELNQLWRRWVAHEDPVAGFELALLAHFFLIQDRAPYPEDLGEEWLSCPEILKARVTSAVSGWSGQRSFALLKNTPPDRDYALQFMEMVCGKIQQTPYGAALRGFLHSKFSIVMHVEGQAISYWDESSAITHYQEAKGIGVALYNAVALMLKPTLRRKVRAKSFFESVKLLLEQTAATNFGPANYCLGLMHDAPGITIDEQVVVPVNLKFAADYYLRALSQGLVDAVTKLQKREILAVLEPEQVLNLLYLIKRFSPESLPAFARYYYEKHDYDFALLFMVENVLASAANNIYDNLQKLIEMWEGRLPLETYRAEINGVQYTASLEIAELAHFVGADNKGSHMLWLSDFSGLLKELKNGVEPFLTDRNHYKKLEKIEKKLIQTRRSLGRFIGKRFGNEVPFHLRLNDLFLEMSKYNSLTDETFTKCVHHFSDHINPNSLFKFIPLNTRLTIVITVLEASPRNAVVNFLLAIAYRGQGNYEKAVECYARYQFCQGTAHITRDVAASDLIALAEQALHNEHKPDASSLHLFSMVQSLTSQANNDTDEPPPVRSKGSPFSVENLRNDTSHLIDVITALCEFQLRQAIDTRCEIETYCALTRALMADNKHQQAIEKWEGYYRYIESCQPQYTAAIAYIIASLYEVMSTARELRPYTKPLDKATTWALKAYYTTEIAADNTPSYRKQAAILTTQILIKKGEYQEAELWFSHIQQNLTQPLNNKEIVELVESVYATQNIKSFETLLSTGSIDNLDCINLLDTLVSYLPILVNEDGDEDDIYNTLRQPISERKAELEKALYAGTGALTTMASWLTTGEGFFRQQVVLGDEEMKTIRPWQSKRFSN